MIGSRERARLERWVGSETLGLTQLSARSLRVDLRWPAVVEAGGAKAASPTAGGDFVGELSPIPVRRIGLAMTELGPVKKLGVISVFSEELREKSTPTIEAVVRQALEEDTAAILKARLLDNVAASTSRPAGLLKWRDASYRNSVGWAARTDRRPLAACRRDSRCSRSRHHHALGGRRARAPPSPGLASAITISHFADPAGGGLAIALDVGDFVSAETKNRQAEDRHQRGRHAAFGR